MTAGYPDELYLSLTDYQLGNSSRCLWLRTDVTCVGVTQGNGNFNYDPWTGVLEEQRFGSRRFAYSVFFYLCRPPDIKNPVCTLFTLSSHDLAVNNNASLPWDYHNTLHTYQHSLPWIVGLNLAKDTIALPVLRFSNYRSRRPAMPEYLQASTIFNPIRSQPRNSWHPQPKKHA